MAINKNIKYINKSFSEYRASLIDYTKTYFPTTYNDFSPASPGMMFIEMAAYVGDVLSFYLDNQVQENYLQFARQSNNLFELAYMFGYKPNVTGVAIVDIDFYQKVPSKISAGSYIPDFDYALYIGANSTVTNTSNVSFLIEDPIDFTVSSSGDPTEITIFEVAGSNPQSFLLKKTRKAISATINTINFSFTSPIRFSTVEINANSLIGILDCVDTEGNNWYEVDHLGQETIYDSIKNTNVNDPNLSQNAGGAPYLLKLKKTQYRFTTRLRDSNTLQIQFGSGTTSDSDEEIIPNPDNVGIGLPFEQDKLTSAYSPSNFLYTKTYGIAPSNTTLTFRYLTGGSTTANVPANTLNTLNGTVNFLNPNLSNNILANDIFNSLAVTNPNAASGGGDGDSIEEIRQNSMANFSSQQRNVTQDDYLVRALSMPSKYGEVAKAYIEPTKLRNSLPGENLSILDLYILTYDINKKLTNASLALKQNLVTYLSQYRMINDSVNIKDAFIINIGLNFDIIILPNYNNNQVLTNCITALQSYFSIENWQINQPIILRDIYVLLDRIEGVQTVKNIEILNFVGNNLGYSEYAYDIPGATKNGVVYPSIDPMIFEIKFPNADIQGRVVSL
jgi:hypothetical protein